jgi:hypothetical protein
MLGEPLVWKTSASRPRSGPAVPVAGNLTNGSPSINYCCNGSGNSSTPNDLTLTPNAVLIGDHASGVNAILQVGR